MENVILGNIIFTLINRSLFSDLAEVHPIVVECSHCDVTEGTITSSASYLVIVFVPLQMCGGCNTAAATATATDIFSLDSFCPFEALKVKAAALHHTGLLRQAEPLNDIFN